MKICELEFRDGLYYNKSSEKPFTGKVSGIENGEIIKGQKEGLWEYYNKNGQLNYKRNYKDGKKEGLWEWY